MPSRSEASRHPPGKLQWRHLSLSVFAAALSLAVFVALSLSLLDDTGVSGTAGTSAPAAADTGVGGTAGTSAPAAAHAPAPRANVTIAATGDIAMGRDGALPADGGAALFDAVKRYLAGDVVLGNLETALTSGGVSKCGAGSFGCFAFRSPPAQARWLARAGFTVLNLANNHSYDYGAQGERDTVAALDRFRLAHTGRPNEVGVQQVGRLRVAILGFAPYPWAQSLLDVEGAKRFVRRADEKADLVVVTIHAGAEGAASAHVLGRPEIYLGESRGNVAAFARAVVDAGADLVVGHGPHVLRGLEWYRKRLIAYSLGNFAGNHNFSLAGPLGVSAILRVTLRGDGSWRRGELVSTRLVGAGTPVPDRARHAQALVRRLSREDFGPRAMRVTRTGRLLPPVR